MRLFVDNLTNVDFSYLCPLRGLVGETWLADIELHGALDEQGMVCDFGMVKKILRQWLDTNLDHCLLVPARNNAVTATKDGIATSVELTLTTGKKIRAISPHQAIVLVDADKITPDLVARWCVAQLKPLFAETIADIHLAFTAEPIDSAYYHYSHGLKKHNGNCQRIAHGHRSKIFIWRDDLLCIDSMHYFAELWRDIYIGTLEDCIFKGEDCVRFAYKAQQGVFFLELPLEHCYFIDTDSTVEYLAKHIALESSRLGPGVIKVKAFEGMGKGALVEYFPTHSSGAGT